MADGYISTTLPFIYCAENIVKLFKAGPCSILPDFISKIEPS